MKKLVTIFAMVLLCQTNVFGQKYEMVIEKVDGTTTVFNTEEILRVYFQINNEEDTQDDTIDKNSLSGVWYLKSEKWYDWVNGQADMSKPPYEKNYEDFSNRNIWEFVKSGDEFIINESKDGELRDVWYQKDENVFRNHEGGGRDRVVIKSVSEKSLEIELYDGYYGEYEDEGTSEYGLLTFMR